MNLLESLAAGIPSAANGTVAIYRRGTSTFATLYADYNGTGAYTPTAALALDANGAIEVFVNEEVDIVVRDASATPVVTTNPMNSASNVEVMSTSFTGTDYDTAASGASLPITLAAVLDKWLTSAGALDWKVLVNSSSMKLSDALALFSGVFYNVKATAYGAKGDITTDDTSAIQAAITTAFNAGGGIVFFPAGTYLITATLTLKAGVSLLGAGAKAVTISLNHATTDAISVDAGTANFAVSIQGITVLPQQSNTGKMLKVESGTVVNVRDCTLGGTNLAGFCVSLDNAATKFTAIGCTFVTGAAVSYGVYADTANAVQTVLIGNRFVAPATMNGDLLHLNATGGSHAVVGNVFDCSGASAGTGRCVLAAASFTIGGNRFQAPTGGTIQPITASGSTGGNFVGLNTRTQSSFWSVQAAAQVSASNATHESSEEYDRNGRTYHTTDNTTPITVNPTLYGVAEVRRTNNANQTINGAAPSGPGQFFTLILNNDQAGGSGTITLGSDFKGLAPFTVGANRVWHIHFRSSENMTAGGGGATKYWTLCNTPADVTP